MKKATIIEASSNIVAYLVISLFAYLFMRAIILEIPPPFSTFVKP